MCLLLLLSGLVDDCGDGGLEVQSKSVLLDCWTKGLVGGIKRKGDAEMDCETALDRTL